MRKSEILATDDIMCLTKSNMKYIKKILSAMTKIRLPTLIMAPRYLVCMWRKKYEKTVLTGILDLQTTHLDENTSFADLYLPLKTDGKEDGFCNNNVVVLRSKTNIKTHIMDHCIYHLYFKLDYQKCLKPVKKLQFARVLVDKAYNIQGANTAFFKNLMKLAANGASIWFIIATPLPKGANSFAGFIKC